MMKKTAMVRWLEARGASPASSATADADVLEARKGARDLAIQINKVLQDGHPRRMADGRNAYRKMSPTQREAFLQWAHDEDPETWRRSSVRH